MDPADEGRALRGAAALEPSGPGRFAVDLSAHYTVIDHPHGGYLQCLVANGALAAASAEGAAHLNATSVTTNFVNAPNVGPGELRVEVRRVGRGVSFVYVALYQGSELSLESLVTLGTLREGAAVRYQDAPAVELSPLEQCRSWDGTDEIAITRVLEVRLDPSTSGWWEGQLSNQAEIRAWLRLDDGGTSWDAWSVLFACDALPPATLPLGSSGWVPTLQLTSYVRRPPTSEWLRARQRAIVIADGLVDERCELFDDAGHLVASSSQIAMVRLPGGN
ncbi:MAG: thioesterase family protein [Acidimicrobiales bacterium]